MYRRSFLQETIAASAAPMLAAPAAGMPAAVLGHTGEKVSRLGFGAWQIGQPEYDQAHVTALVNRAVELGVHYIDTAPNYGASEERLGPAIQPHRDRLFLATKTEEPTAEGTWNLLRQSLKRLRTDRLDLVHLHSLGVEKRFPDLRAALGKQGALGALLEAKKKGIVRFIGVSGHCFPSRFHAALDTGEIDVLMNAVSFVSQHVYDFEHKVWSRARQMNVGLVAMKVIGGSKPKQTEARLSGEWYDLAVRYALSTAGAATAVIGLRTIAELERAAGSVARARPLSVEDASALYRKGVEMAQEATWNLPYGGPAD